MAAVNLLDCCLTGTLPSRHQTHKKHNNQLVATVHLLDWRLRMGAETPNLPKIVLFKRLGAVRDTA